MCKMSFSSNIHEIRRTCEKCAPVGTVPAGFPFSYADWESLHGLGAWGAADARGIHNVFRYAFNVPTGDFALLLPSRRV